jgi:hypothetical protein
MDNEKLFISMNNSERTLAHDVAMLVSSVFEIVAERIDSQLTTKNSRTSAGTLRTPPVTYGAAITDRTSGTKGSGAMPTTVTARTRRDDESPHLIDIVV